MLKHKISANIRRKPLVTYTMLMDEANYSGLVIMKK